jgi:hypothetical protein
MRKFLLSPAFFCFLAITSSQVYSQSRPAPPSLSNYEITEEETKTIEGVSYSRSMLLYKNSIITVSIYNRRKDGDKGHNYYGLSLVYIGDGWLFLEKMKIKIDNEDAITLVDKSPSRSVRSTRSVQESLSFVLEDKIIKSLRECNSLSIQPVILIEIPPDGIEKIKEFLAEQASKN